MLGTCRQLSVGPEAALSLIMGEAIAAFISSEEHAHGTLDLHHKMKLTTAITSIIVFQAGLITFALGMLRLGFLDAVLSRASVSLSRLNWVCADCALLPTGSITRLHYSSRTGHLCDAIGADPWAGARDGA